MQTGTYQKNMTLGSAIVDILQMAKRTLIVLFKTPEKWFDIMFMPLIFMLMFTYLFGGAISGDVKSYLPIIVPGVFVQSMMSAASGAGTQLREDMETGVFDRFRSLPMARIAPLAGLLVADVVRYMISLSVSLGVGTIIGWRPEAGWGYAFVAILLVLLVTFAMSWIFALIGLLLKSASAVSSISQVLMMVLTFASGAFVPTSTMPKVLQHVVSLNPVNHLITAFKEVANHGQFTGEVTWVLLVSVAMVVVIAPITVMIYNKNV